MHIGVPGKTWRAQLKRIRKPCFPFKMATNGIYIDIHHFRTNPDKPSYIGYPLIYTYIYTIWLFNIAMENPL